MNSVSNQSEANQIQEIQNEANSTCCKDKLAISDPFKIKDFRKIVYSYLDVMSLINQASKLSKYD